MQWADVVAIVRRWWWILVVVALVTSGLSVVRWLRTPPVYDATRTVSLAVLPAGMPSGQQSYLAEQQALATARFVASPDFLTASTFDTAVSHALATASDQSLRQASPLELGRALSASHSGVTIRLTATWETASGAESLAIVAVATLAQDNPQIAALFSGGVVPRFAVAADTSPAVRDVAAADSARDALFTRLALSLLAGLLVMAALGLLERRQANMGIPTQALRQNMSVKE